MWFSPWQAELVLALVDSILSTPLLALARKHSKQHQAAPAPRSEEAAAVASNKRTAVLIDVSMLTVMGFATMPVSSALGSEPR